MSNIVNLNLPARRRRGFRFLTYLKPRENYLLGIRKPIMQKKKNYYFLRGLRAFFVSFV